MYIHVYNFLCFLLVFVIADVLCNCGKNVENIVYVTAVINERLCQYVITGLIIRI